MHTCDLNCIITPPLQWVCSVTTITYTHTNTHKCVCAHVGSYWNIPGHSVRWRVLTNYHEWQHTAYWQPCILWKCSSLPQFKSYLTIIANSYSSRNTFTISHTFSCTLGSVSSSSAESPVVSTLSSASSAVMRNILLRWAIASQSTCCYNDELYFAHSVCISL